jgi:hypothetical protein
MDEKGGKLCCFIGANPNLTKLRALKVKNTIPLTRLIWLTDRMHWRYTVYDCKFHVFGRKASHVAPQIIACNSGSTQHSVADASPRPRRKQLVWNLQKYETSQCKLMKIWTVDYIAKLIWSTKFHLSLSSTYRSAHTWMNHVNVPFRKPWNFIFSPSCARHDITPLHVSMY